MENRYWYVAHAPNVRIFDLVKKLKIKLGEENVVFPVVKDRKHNQRTNKFVEKEVPLYFNYVFLRLGEYDPVLEDDIKQFCSTHITILSDPSSNLWWKVTDDEMEKVLETQKEALNEMLNVGSEYNIGDRVKILIGAFKFFNGTIKNINLQNKRVTINVVIFNRDTPVDVDIEGIEKVK